MSTDGMPFARIEQSSPTPSSSSSSSSSPSQLSSRYLLFDSRQRVNAGILLFCCLCCCIRTSEALAYYVGTSQGEQVAQPEIALSKDERITIVRFCRAAQRQESIRAKLKDPEAFLRICDQLVNEFKRLRAQANNREKRRVL